MLKNLEELILLVRSRKKTSSENSYTKKLLNDNLLATKKVREEIEELIDSVKKDSNKIHEAADVFYHLIVYLEANGIKIEDVIEELNKELNKFILCFKMKYDENNIFAKILRGEIPCKKIYEDDYILSFYDINPQKKNYMP